MDPPRHEQSSNDYLFRSDSGLLNVIDIPLSIAHSQCLRHDQWPQKVLYATATPEKPYPSIEPRSARARANVLARLDVDIQQRHSDTAMFIRDGLNRIRQLHSSPWCAARCLKDNSQENLARSSKRKLASEDSDDNSHRLQEAMPFNVVRLQDYSDQLCSPAQKLQQMIIHNTQDIETSIESRGESGEITTYYLPPESIVCQSAIHKQSVLGFEMAFEQIYSRPSDTAGAGQLDIILMDPPWSNRSALRGNQYGLLDESGEDPLNALSEALPRLLASEGLLAIWITNKSSVRDRAMRIFLELDIETVEEWFWIKVTTTGEPVYDLDGIYRQPWETCLVGRRRQELSVMDQKICRRLIAACPDLHSRKPAIGRMLTDHYNTPNPGSLRKLEIFARYASAGWCAWGDEALKFNNVSCWTNLAATAHEEDNTERVNSDLRITHNKQDPAPNVTNTLRST